MEAMPMYGGLVILALILVLLWRKSSPAARLAAARLGANGLIGAVAGPLATLAGLYLVALITGAKLDLRSRGRDMMATTVLQMVLFAMAFWGGFTGPIVGARDRGVRVVTLWNFVRVFLCGFAGMLLGVLVASTCLELGLTVLLGRFLAALLCLLLALLGLYVGMSVSTTRPPDSEEARRRH